ncbi:hypothetical protein RclHR1_10740008 [Rhizophagus clarus]|uniref:Uncharacterized protein n=1 Tax=Rhizophagus clarus TaxID=94130 RepID=A0A2Z6QEH8_9GLOM|nr:hypothetical protein RclHR1_10740008 [Rhizophagus clarus]
MSDFYVVILIFLDTKLQAFSQISSLELDDQFLEHLDAVFGKTVFKFLLGLIGYWRFSGDYLESLDLDFISDGISAGKLAPLKPDKVS